MHVAPTITWAIKGWEGTRRITTRWMDVRKWQVVDVHESMAIHGWNKANIYYTLPRCICTYLTNNIWFKNVGKICAMTNLPKPPLVDVKQYSVWQFALGNSFMTQSPITPSSQQISGHTIWCIVSQHYVEVLLPSAYISNMYANRFMMIFDNLCVCVYRLYSICPGF